MKWLVYHNTGCCNEGDHEVGLEEFDTKEEAIKFIQDRIETTDEKATLIHGEIIAEV